MKMYTSWQRFISLIVCFGISACTASQSTQVPLNTGTPSQTEIPVPVETVSPVIPTPTAEPADTIFYNGNLITIEGSQPVAEAIALRDGLILAVGTSEDILALQGSGTRVVDLQGQTLMPGFIDGHNHLMVNLPSDITLDEGQAIALRYGFTSMNDMGGREDRINELMQAESRGDLHLRVNIFAKYNASFLDENRKSILLQEWFPANAPILDPQRFLRIPGIKIFLDGDNASYARGCWALTDPYEPGAPILSRGVCGTERGDLYWSQEELNQVVSQAQNAGYRVAFHAMGDQAIEMALRAIEFALDGKPNADVRHQIEHNSLARTDQLGRYEALDVLVSVRGHGVTWCDLETLQKPFGKDRYLWYLNRFALAGMDLHAYIETDFGWNVGPDERFAPRGLDPIVQLYGMVTHNYVLPDGSICAPGTDAPDLPVSVERALQMLTIEPAYAVSMEDFLGSLKPGKFADLIILSGDPLTVDPQNLKDLQVWMTMVAGRVEYCAAGQEALCPGDQAAENLPSSGNLALHQSVRASNNMQNPAELVVDGNESTSWGAGDFAPQWIEIDLGAPASISEIRLLVGQSPDGKTRHRILVGSKGGTLTEIHLFEQITQDVTWITFTPDAVIEDVQIVRIETLESPSWVAWLEIQVIGTR